MRKRPPLAPRPFRLRGDPRLAPEQREGRYSWQIASCIVWRMPVPQWLPPRQQAPGILRGLFVVNGTNQGREVSGPTTAISPVVLR